MKLVPYMNRPMRESYDLMNGLIDDFFKSDFDHSVFDTFKVDVEKDDNKYIVTADLPGIAKEDLDVDVEDGMLTIAVHKEASKEESDKEHNYLHRERSLVNASRRIRLGDVDEEKITASLENGVLQIELPLQEEVSKKKNIEIR